MAELDAVITALRTGIAHAQEKYPALFSIPEKIRHRVKSLLKDVVIHVDGDRVPFLQIK